LRERNREIHIYIYIYIYKERGKRERERETKEQEVYSSETSCDRVESFANLRILERATDNIPTLVTDKFKQGMWCG
jgi:hypothetical protein